MTIERLHFEKPRVVYLREDLIDESLDVFLENVDGFQVLAEGEYDLTPPSWRTNTHKHNLIVNADGTGVYRLLPIDQRSALVGSDRSFKSGGQTIRLPQDREIAVIMGGIPTGKFGIFEIIHYKPGQSPRK